MTGRAAVEPSRFLARAMRFLAIAASLSPGLSAHAAELRLLCDGPLAPALGEIARAFETETGHSIRLVTATSPELLARLRNGEVADGVAIQRGLLDRLISEGRAAAEPRVMLGRIGLGLAVRVGAPMSPIGDASSLRAALLSADAVIFNDVASGEHFVSVIERLGIVAEIQPRLYRTNPAGVFRRLREGQGRDFGVGTISQILAAQGLTLLGPLPDEFQGWLAYDAAPLTAAPEPAVTRQWLAFLQRPASRIAFAIAGGEAASD